MRLGIIGCGAIGTDVAKAADAMEEITKIYLFDKNPTATERLCPLLKKASVKPVHEFLKDVDVVFEAASQQAVVEYSCKRGTP
jgi:aspartate dehydrogenase